MPQKSTEDALCDAIGHVRAGIGDKKLVTLVSLDIEGAFDGAWWPAIVEELRRRTTDDWTFGIICSYLEDRRVTIRYLGETVTAGTERGCIQGSIGGPLLWNLLLDPTLRRADLGRTRVQALADDTLVLAIEDSIRDLNAQVNGALSAITK